MRRRHEDAAGRSSSKLLSALFAPHRDDPSEERSRE
jgi:hypothetical protein